VLTDGAHRIDLQIAAKELALATVGAAAENAALEAGEYVRHVR
jgi:hypothetical protein